MLSLLRNNGTQLAHTFYIDGVATDADGPVTIHITKADGSDLVPSGTATVHGAPNSGTYSYILGPQTNLNILTVTWTGTFSGVVQSQSDDIEIVGGFYVALSELRTVPGLSDAAKVSNDDLIATRREFEDLAERYCGVAFVPRFARETIAGRGGVSLLLGNPRPRVLLSASSTSTSGGSTPFTTTNWNLNLAGTLTTDGATLTASVYGEQNIVVEYEHGYDSPPAVLVRACKEYCKDRLVKDRSQTSRSMPVQTEPGGGTYFPPPRMDDDHPTGIESVDAVLQQVGRRAPAIA